MKSILKLSQTVFGIALLFAAPALAQSQLPASVSGIVRQKGVVYFIKDGRPQKVERQLRLSEGINVEADGRVTFKDGTKMTMKDGEMITLEGKITVAPPGIPDDSDATVTVPKGASGSDASGNGAIGAGSAGGGATVGGSAKGSTR